MIFYIGFAKLLYDKIILFKKYIKNIVLLYQDGKSKQ
jgi:hypothetical protein